MSSPRCDRCPQVANLSSTRPAAGSKDFNKAFLNDYNDTLVVTYLASVTKLTSMTHELAEKFGLAYSDRRRRGV
jgi:COP9 signalosome complex subunit 6